MGWGSRLALLLLILNLVVLGTGWALERYRESERYLPGYNLDKILPLQSPAAGGPAGARASAGKGGDTPDEAPARPAGPGDSAASAAPTADAHACLVLERYDQAAHDRLRDELAAAGLRPDDYAPRLAKNLGWWVYIPPESDAALRQATVARLREQGVTDLAIISRGSMTNAISLGMFADAGQAQAHLARLRAMGVSAAIHGPRPDSGPARLDLSSLSASRRAALPDGLRQRLQACPTPDTARQPPG